MSRNISRNSWTFYCPPFSCVSHGAVVLFSPTGHFSVPLINPMKSDSAILVDCSASRTVSSAAGNRLVSRFYGIRLELWWFWTAAFVACHLHFLAVAAVYVQRHTNIWFQLICFGFVVREADNVHFWLCCMQFLLRCNLFEQFLVEFQSHTTSSPPRINSKTSQIPSNCIRDSACSSSKIDVQLISPRSTVAQRLKIPA